MAYTQAKPVHSLKDAFDAGFESFYVFDTTLDHRGKMKGNPVNPYYKGTLSHKNFEQGFNAAYFKNQKECS